MRVNHSRWITFQYQMQLRDRKIMNCNVQVSAYLFCFLGGRGWWCFCRFLLLLLLFLLLLCCLNVDAVMYSFSYHTNIFCLCSHVQV